MQAVPRRQPVGCHRQRHGSIDQGDAEQMGSRRGQAGRLAHSRPRREPRRDHPPLPQRRRARRLRHPCQSARLDRSMPVHLCLVADHIERQEPCTGSWQGLQGRCDSDRRECSERKQLSVRAAARRRTCVDQRSFQEHAGAVSALHAGPGLRVGQRTFGKLVAKCAATTKQQLSEADTRANRLALRFTTTESAKSAERMMPASQASQK